MLNDREYRRYARQIMVDDIGESGQLRFKHARIAIVGLGGLGCPAAQYLAAAGVGQLTLIDDDVVELSNLQRQILFTEADIGKAKVLVAKQRLRQLNPLVQVHSQLQRLTPQNASQLLANHDIVLDCSDNFVSRYSINRYCAEHNLPLVSGAAAQRQGQLSLFPKPQQLCYQCLFPAEQSLAHAETATESNGNCQTLGVIAPLLGIIGSQQALLTLNLLLTPEQPAQCWQLQGQSGRWLQFNLHSNAICPLHQTTEAS